MTGFEYYLIFAFTTAIVALLELFIPALKSLALTHEETNVIQYKVLTLGTLFLMAILFAPLIFPACVIPSFGSRFRTALHISLEKE